MDKLEDLYHRIAVLEVFDTHTHLRGDQLGASDFWEIVHYFWYAVELLGAGYPLKDRNLREDERVDLFLEGYRNTRGTSMNWCVTRIVEDLYGIRLKDRQSVYDACDAVKAASGNSEWAGNVAERVALRKIVVNEPQDVPFIGLQDAAYLLPRIDSRLKEWIDRIASSPNQPSSCDEVSAEIAQLLQSYRQQGCQGIMTTVPRHHVRTFGFEVRLRTTSNTEDEIVVYLLHRICEAAEANGLFVQFFLGIEGGWKSGSLSVHDPERVAKLYGLFERYACSFELVSGSEGSNLDVLQAARDFGHVHAGGLWWYNFRESSYLQVMQYRVEALALSKSSIVVSDSRSIEWCYGKILWIKRLLAQFLHGRIEAGWIDREGAIEIAKAWLYDSAALRYRV